MLDITSFDAVFSFDRQAEYSKERLQAINKSRNKLPRLFIERLLLTLDLEHVATLYPPRANKGLREFHHEIVNSNIATHHKQALLYYVLNDLQPPEDETDRFANEVDLPKAYKFAMLGFWEMDRLEFRVCYMSLFPQFVWYAI